MPKIFIIILITANIAFGQNYKQYKDFIIKSEGIRNKPYRCSQGHLTVGVGHKIEKSEKFKSFYSNSEIEDLFKKDLNEAIRAAQNNFPSFSRQPDHIKLVLVSFCFNLGEAGSRKFVKFRRAIESRNYQLAALELKKSLWYKQVTARANKYISIIVNTK